MSDFPGAAAATVPHRPWDPGEPADAVDRAVLATRRAVFPLLGLDPYDPRD
jgi:acetoin utilization protein AcuC